MASLLISVTSKGLLTCMKKLGKGSLDPESIFEMMEVRELYFNLFFYKLKLIAVFHVGIEE